MGKKSAPIQVVVHYPQTPEGWAELRSRVAQVHASYVTQCIDKLNCSPKQKLELLDAVIETARHQQAERGQRHLMHDDELEL